MTEGGGVMMIWVVGYLLGAAGTFIWLLTRNLGYCSGLEDCLLTGIGDVAWGLVWPVFWMLEFF